MKLIQPVRIVHILTEKSKADLHHIFTEQQLRLEQECQQLLFEQKKLEHQMKDKQQTIAEKFQKELNARIEKQHQLQFKLEQLHSLPLGSEIVEKEVDALVEVAIGVKWDEITKQTTIVIEDGVVVRIDQS